MGGWEILAGSPSCVRSLFSTLDSKQALPSPCFFQRKGVAIKTDRGQVCSVSARLPRLQACQQSQERSVVYRKSAPSSPLTPSFGLWKPALQRWGPSTPVANCTPDFTNPLPRTHRLAGNPTDAHQNDAQAKNAKLCQQVVMARQWGNQQFPAGSARM